MAISVCNPLTTELRATVIAAVRTAFLVVGIASTIFILSSIAVPYSACFLSSSLPRIRTIIFTWLSPSYLFITVHFIIILIWQLRDHNYRPPAQNEEEFQYLSKQLEIPGPIPPSLPDLLESEQDPSKPGDTEIDESYDTIDATWKAIVEKSTATRDHNYRPPVQNEEEFQYLSKQLEIPGPIPPSLPDLLDSEQDPSKSGDTELDESHDTMDATWKAIVEKSTAAAEAATRPPMRKSDTWERCGRDREDSSEVTQERKFRKSETFRRISMGREELYRVADAFIGTHYAQRRIQRQESKQQNIRMVNAAC